MTLDKIPRVETALSGPSLAAAINAALQWWHDAGVDCDFADEPQDWLAASNPKPVKPLTKSAAKAPETVTKTIGGGRSAWPATLAEFVPWWLSEASLAPAGAVRMAPVGPETPPLMVIVPMPEESDRETLLAGPIGNLLDGFLAAAGLSRDKIYLASALPARVAAPDWADLAKQGLGDLIAHHVGLIRPERLILFGQSGISTLLGNDSPNTCWHLRPIYQGDAGIPVLSAYDLETMVARPALKAKLWSRWLDWTGANAT